VKTLSPEGIAVIGASALAAAGVFAIHRWRTRKDPRAEARQLIEALEKAIATVELNETQQAILLNRHLPAIEKVAKRSQRYKAGIFWLSMSVISTNFLLQVIGSFGPGAGFNPARWLALITAIQSLLLAFKELSGMESRAISSQETLSKLLAEAWSFFGLSGQYRDSSHATAAAEMFGDMENILLDNALSSFPRVKEIKPKSEDPGRSPYPSISPERPTTDQPEGRSAGFKFEPIDSGGVVPIEELREAALRLKRDL
jgi:hypothetical protein